MKLLGFFFFISCILQSCGGGNASFDYHTRDLIDSLTNQQNTLTTVEVEKYCRDSMDALVLRAVDSLILVREREIRQTIGE